MKNFLLLSLSLDKYLQVKQKQCHLEFALSLLFAIIFSVQKFSRIINEKSSIYSYFVPELTSAIDKSYADEINISKCLLYLRLDQKKIWNYFFK